MANSVETLNFINHSLASFGLPAVSIACDSNDKEASNLANVMVSVLHSLQNKNQYGGDLEARLARLYADYEASQAQLVKSRNHAESAEKETFNYRVKAEQLETSLAELSRDSQAVKEELRSVKSALAHAKNQHLHDLRKKDRDQEKLQTTLQRHATAASKEAKMSFKLIAPSKSPISTQSTADKSKAADSAEDLYAEALANSENREKALIAENVMLRQSLYDAYVCVESLLSDSVEPLLKQSDLRAKQQVKARFFLPFEDVVNRVDGTLRSSVDQLRARIEMMDDNIKNGSPADGKEIQKLKSQLEEHRRVIKEQQNLIESAMAAESQRDTSLNQHSRTESESTRRELERDRELVDKQKRTLETERKNFTEAAIKLGKERAAFEREKEEFEDEKRMLETQQVLKDLPTTPSWLRKSIRRVDQTQSYSPFNPQVSHIVASGTLTSALTPSVTSKSKPINKQAMNEKDGNQSDGENADLNLYFQQSMSVMNETPKPPTSIATTNKAADRYKSPNWNDENTKTPIVMNARRGKQQ